jgi:hypothetical protein
MCSVAVLQCSTGIKYTRTWLNMAQHGSILGKSGDSDQLKIDRPAIEMSINYGCINKENSRSQWSRGLRRRSAAARLLRSWVRISPEAWMFVRCEFCVLSGRGLYDELITRPEESYRIRYVVVCDLETSRMRRSWLAFGRSATAKINKWIK